MLPRSHLHVKPSRKSQVHVGQFWRNWVGRGYFVAVTGSTWLRSLRGCYEFHVVTFQPRITTWLARKPHHKNNHISCVYNAHISIQRGCSRRDPLLLPRSLDTISRPHLQCTIFTPKGAFLAELPIVALQANTYTTLYPSQVHILPGTHLYTWVESRLSSNVDKVSCWRTKVPGIATYTP